jgi:nucleoside-diphosphate-sugar epimerase
MIQSVSIVGCGWLGLPLGEHLLAQGLAVKGSTTTPEKLSVLATAGIHPFLLSLRPQPAPGQVNELRELLDTDLLVIDIPPGVEKQGPSFHPEQIRFLTERLQDSPVQGVIYVSSTSVYPEVSREVDETEPLVGHDPTSTAILQAERTVQGWGGNWVILRCGGLMGYNRIPGKYVAAKKGLGTGDVPVNFVHRDDVVGIISEVIRQGITNRLYNVVTPLHPKRREIYARNAADFGYALPQYAEGPLPDHKVVSSRKLVRDLQYAFRYENPLHFSYAP